MNTIIDPFDTYKQEYWKKKTTRERKGRILDSVEELTGMHRISIIRKFKRLQFVDTAAKKSMPTKQGRPCLYNQETIRALKDLWEASEKVCGELLHPMIDEYIYQYKKVGSWTYNDDIECKLRKMSVSTIKRKVVVFYKKDRDRFRKGKTTTKPSSIKVLIPIRDTSWFNASVGEGQLDTVVHSGDTLSGNMAYTLNFTDYKTYWIGLRAQMGKGQHATTNSLLYIKKNQLPFVMKSIHPDTGSEFINYHMKTCCDRLGIEMTRSRPNHKNDNMCVEERNGHVVRKKIGYIRIDCKESVVILNRYYDTLCVLFNHFVAVRRTKEKTRVGAQYRRTFEKPKTPYMMVMGSNEISHSEKKQLRDVHNTLNVFVLKEEMQILLEELKNIQIEKRGKLF